MLQICRTDKNIYLQQIFNKAQIYAVNKNTRYRCRIIMKMNKKSKPRKWFIQNQEDGKMENEL